MSLYGKKWCWIGRPVQTQTKLVCRETERATADLNTRMKSSWRGASNSAGHIFISSAFGESFLKIDENALKSFVRRTAGCASPKALIRMSQELLKCLSLAANYFLGSPAAVYLLENRSRLSKLVSIEIDRNTKVQVITSTIGRFITKFFKLVVMN